MGSKVETDGMRSGLGLTQGEGHPCHAEPIRDIEGMVEGGVPVTLGTPLSLLETLWASINETLMK